MRIALQALRRNVMRTALTMLGVIIGVAAVIAMMEISRGASVAIQVTVTNMGANTLIVTPGAPKGGSVRYGTRTDTLTPDDAEAMARECPSVVATAPIVNAWGQVVYGNRNWSTGMTGSTADFLKMRNWSQLGAGADLQRARTAQRRQGLLDRQDARPRAFRQPLPDRRGDPRQERALQGHRRAQREGRQPPGHGPGRHRLRALDHRQVSPQRRGAAAPRPARIPSMPRRASRWPSGCRAASTPCGPRASSRSWSRRNRRDAIPRACDEITRLLRDRHHLAEDETDFRIYDNAEVSNVFKRVVGMLSGPGHCRWRPFRWWWAAWAS